MSQKMPNEWKCSGCGAPSPDRVKSCDCITSGLFQQTDSGLKSAVKRPVYAYDIKCLDLARHFLRDSPDDSADLAQHIQEAIEDWLGDREAIAKATA